MARSFGDRELAPGSVDREFAPGSVDRDHLILGHLWPLQKQPFGFRGLLWGTERFVREFVSLLCFNLLIVALFSFSLGEYSITPLNLTFAHWQDVSNNSVTVNK